ncbi:hypothetical protein [Nitrosomonas sp.]|uniref:hypothetical protein n=1 Tax=Nitrosomonas sp. TaxID=42353 RepID=UPI0025E5A410|nr:hypothetical protein [Nitrosomonas sp.]
MHNIAVQIVLMANTQPFLRLLLAIIWIVVSEILSITIAMMLLSVWPQQSAALLGILVRINSLTSGTVTSLLGFRANPIDSAEHERNNSKSGS